MLFKENSGVGLNLRLEYIDQIIDLKPKLPFLEIIVDNWFSLGAHHKKLEKIRQDYPISFHCVGLNLGGFSAINHDYIKKVKQLNQSFKPFQISDHLCFQSLENNYFHDLLPIPMNDDTLKNTISRVNQVQELLNQEILIENLSYYVEFIDSTYSEIDFLNQVLKQTGASMLLDLNNIWVNELNLKIKSEDFLQKILWEKVKEIHVAGPEVIDGIYVDTHGTHPHPDVLNLLQRYSKHILGLPVVYERDNNIPPLSELLDQVQKIAGHL